jgi:hypothetical protein
VAIDRGVLPIVAATGPLGVSLSARDPQGHVTTASAGPAIVSGAGSYVCDGDDCGCCLLTATDPLTQCRGLDGITSPDFPDGLCRAF